MSEEPRVFIDMSENNTADTAKGCGYYVRLPDLNYAIKRIEGISDSQVIGIIYYNGENTAELLLDPPLGDEEE